MSRSVSRARRFSLATQRKLWAYAFTLPTFLYYLVVHIGSMLTSFSYSFQEYRTVSSTRSFVGLDNYRYILRDPYFNQALMNTLKFAAVRVPVVVILSLVVALLLTNIRRGKGFFRTIYFIPFVTSGVAVAWVWKFIYLPNLGVLTPALDLLGVPRIYVLGDPKYAFFGITAVTVWTSLGYYALIFLAGLEGIPQAFYDAAKIDGATSWQQLRYVTIPLLNRTVVLIGVLILISSLSMFTIIRTMSPDSTGGPMGTTRTLPIMIYMQAFNSLRMGRASAIAVVFFLIVLIASLIQRRLLTREY